MNNLATLIPHRPPMHWLDRAWLEADGSIAARWIIPERNAVINRLRHGTLVSPAALIEVLAQAAACIAGLTARQDDAPIPSGRLVALENMSFLAAIHVGDTVGLRVTIVRRWQELLKCKLDASVNGRFAAEGLATFALVRH